MADKVPVKAIFTGSDVTSLGEFASSDTINGSYIADDSIDEANLKVSNSPTNGYVLTAQSGASGGLTWALDAATDSTKLPLAGGTLTGAVMTATDTDTSNTGSITLNFSTNQNFVLTLTGNVTLANPSTEAIGQSGFIAFIQDGTGSRTVALGTDYETAGAAGLTLTSTASATDLVPYLVVASNRILLGTPQLAFA
tara:strand:+ start:7489 stop:8076 length:588 start_codon:yes stop_codon:yes gene_type:complete